MMIYNNQVNWYDIKDYVILYLDHKTIKKMISLGIYRAGSLSKLCIKLNSMHLYERNDLKNLSHLETRNICGYLHVHIHNFRNIYNNYIIALINKTLN